LRESGFSIHRKSGAKASEEENVRKADLPAVKRADRGKNAARRLRREGMIPAVLYGKGAEPLPLSVEKKAFAAIMHGQEGHNALLSMKITGQENLELLSMPKEIQFDPLSGSIVHVDFQQVHLDEAISTAVPVHLTGASAGVKLGGVLEHLCREIEIECLPMDVPASIEIDISGLQIGDSIHVSDLRVSDKVRILDDPSTTVALVAAPTVEKAPEEVVPGAVEGEPSAAAGEEKAKEE